MIRMSHTTVDLVWPTIFSVKAIGQQDLINYLRTFNYFKILLYNRKSLSIFVDSVINQFTMRMSNKESYTFKLSLLIVPLFSDIISNKLFKWFSSEL